MAFPVERFICTFADMAAFTRVHLLAMSALFLGSQNLYAGEIQLGEGKLLVNGSVFVGTVIRTDDRDTALLPNVNSSTLGIHGTALGGRNRDDGDLNFRRGDAVSTVVKGYLSLDYKWRNYGAVVSGKAWYDYALADQGHPWGNVQNRFAAGEPLSDAGALPRSRFSGAVSDNFYGYGSNQAGSLPLDWKFGFQKLDWGNRYAAIGGLRDLTPIDFPGSLRPGAMREDETRIAIPAAFARLGMTPSSKVEFFYQFKFEPNAPVECGTFFSNSDYSSEGCNAAFVSTQPDGVALANGSYLKRVDTPDPSNSGQFGIALKRSVDSWATEFGIYAAQFHSRSSVTSGIKSQRVGTPYIDGDPGNLNAKYFTEYPEEIQIFGMSFDKKVRGGAVYGELTYRPNQPYSYNGIDMTNAFISSTAPTTIRDSVDHLAPGEAFFGAERHKALQLLLAFTQDIPKRIGGAKLSVGAEAVYKRVPDLPDPSITRFGRSELFGQGPVNGACPPPATPEQCSLDGYVSRDAWGYRLRATLQYPNVFDGVDVIPSISFGHDVKGWSGDQGIIEDRKFAVVSLRTKSSRGWTWELAWVPTWGGAYNPLRDRSTAQTNIGYQF